MALWFEARFRKPPPPEPEPERVKKKHSKPDHDKLGETELHKMADAREDTKMALEREKKRKALKAKIAKSKANKAGASGAKVNPVN